MPAHRSRGVAARAARQASSRSLPHDDRAGHQLAVDGAVVLVRAGSIKPDRIRPAPGHGAAAREARRADRTAPRATTATPAVPTPTPTAAVRTRAPVPAASCQRHERQHADYRCAYTHFESSSARRLAGAGLFPVDEQEAARRVELRLARSRQDLQLQLFDLVLGAIPAREREVAVASRT